MSLAPYVRRLLLAGTCLAAPLITSQAAAQTAPETATGLEEVVVTATHQSDTVNRVPLSIAAINQNGLNQQGIKSAPDLVRTVPGVNATGAVNGVAIFSIRGIVANVGAATTGIYLDDTSVSKRANTGIQQNNGAPAPLLFDLERIEVLKGPQGTLYGGSSEGGTIRYITPTPSLTTMSGTVMIEGNKYKAGDEGYDVGAAIGGPIIQDKLAFRISGLRRKTPGYIDVYNVFDNQLLSTDVNGRTEHAIRGSLLWQITPRASALLAVYSTKGKAKSDARYYNSTLVYAPDGKLAGPNQTFTTPQLCFDTATYLSRPQGTPGGIGTRPAALPDCARAGQPGIFVRPSFTYGPFKPLNKDQAFAIVGQSRVTGLGPENEFDVGSLTLNYDFDNMNLKSITSYVQDWQGYYSSGGEDPNTSQYTLEAPNKLSFPLFPLRGAQTGIVGDYTGGFQGRNERYGIQQEIRFSSKADARPFSWVGGVYYSNSRTHILYSYPGNGDRISMAFWGLTADQRYGIDLATGRSFNTDGARQAWLDAQIHDNELAAFGDVNYWITEKLKATAGIRFSRVQLDYFQLAWGQFDQRAVTAAQSITNGVAKASPVTPKFGLQYSFTPDDLVYANVAKGFRAGGVNPQVSEAFCADGLRNAGIRSDQVPPAYGPDTVWSYELGGKFRLLDNRMQINGAVYRIDWNGVQATVPLTCGFNFVMNGGKARSEGFDLQAQYRPVQPLTLSLNVGYTNARYIDGVAGPNPASGARPSINPGDGFGIPKWQVAASALYEQELTTVLMGYVRGDLQYLGDYLQGTSYGTAPYNPFTREVGSQTRVNLRVGVRFDRLDVNVYANNLFNNRSRVGNGGVGRTNCGVGSVDCSVFGNFNPFVQQAFMPPRMIGVQALYNF